MEANCVHLQTGSTSIWVSQDLRREAEIEPLANPDLLFSHPQCEIIKDQKKIKVGRIPLEIGGKVKAVYLKRYNAFSWRYRLGSLFVTSGARRSLAGANTLTRAGFLTGRPIAAVECRCWGMLTKSFYISEEVPGGKTVDLYWQEELIPVRGKEGFRRRRGFLKALALLFRFLHERNIYHNDLKDANILVCPGENRAGESFYLLDLEGIRSYRRLNRRRQVKNLVQLHRTMGRFLERNEGLYWLKVYLRDLFSDSGERRKWIGRILRESDRRDRRSRRKT
jgi:serine/threonine protein kinase